MEGYTKLVKVISPEGDIIGVYKSVSDVPNRIPNRMHSYYYPKRECNIVEVTDPKDIKRLLPSLEKKGK